MSSPVRLSACLAGGWLLLATATVHARMLQYPDIKNVDPLLRFELPDGWKTSQTANEVDALECDSSHGSRLVVLFMTVPAVDVDKDFTGMAQSIMQLSRVGRSARLIASGKDTVGDGLAVEFARFARKSEGEPLTLTLYHVRTHGDRAVLVSVTEFTHEPAGRKKISRKLLASIRLIQN